MEWLLLWLALSAISLEGLAFFIHEESYHKEFAVMTKISCNKHDVISGITIGALLYVLTLILSPVVAYVLLSIED